MNKTIQNNGVPKYRQVIQTLTRKIKSGTLAAGERIPTEAELENDFGVSRITVRQALQFMESEGLLRREPGRGTFVSELDKHDLSDLTIGFLLIDVSPNNDYNYKEIHTTERYLSEMGVPFTWASLTNEDIVRGNFPAAIANGMCDGVILEGHVTEAHFALEERFGIKIVAVGNHDIPGNKSQVRLRVTENTKNITYRMGQTFKAPVILAVEPMRLAVTREIWEGYAQGLKKLGQNRELVYLCPDKEPPESLAKLLTADTPYTVLTTEKIYPRICNLCKQAGINLANIPMAVEVFQNIPLQTHKSQTIYELRARPEKYQVLAAKRLMELIQGKRSKVFEELDFEILAPQEKTV